MKFARYPGRSNEARPRSNRRVAMARRAVKNELEKVALFPELARWQDPVKKMDEQDQVALDFITRQREFAAAKWRQGRRDLKTLPPIVAQGIKAWWQSDCQFPRDPVFLTSAIHLAKKGHSYWRRLRILKQFQLIRDGLLPKSVIQSIRAWD